MAWRTLRRRPTEVSFCKRFHGCRFTAGRTRSWPRSSPPFLQAFAMKNVTCLASRGPRFDVRQPDFTKADAAVDGQVGVLLQRGAQKVVVDHTHRRGGPHRVPQPREACKVRQRHCGLKSVAPELYSRELHLRAAPRAKVKGARGPLSTLFKCPDGVQAVILNSATHGANDAIRKSDIGRPWIGPTVH